MIKVWTGVSVGYSYMPVLYPNWGVHTKDAHLFFSKKAFTRFNKPFVEVVDNPDSADFLLVPHNFPLVKEKKDYLDKAALEAMACWLKILTSNEAFKNIVPKESFTSNNPQEIAEKIEKLGETGHANMVNFAEYAAKNHGLYSLVGKIINFFA